MAKPTTQPRRPQRPLVALAVLGALSGATAPAGAAEFFWSSGSYLTFNAPFASPNPIAVGDTVFAFGDVDKNFVSVNLAIQGTLSWETNARLGFSSSSVSNTGLIDIVGDASLTHIGGGVGTVTNGGTFRKSAGTGTTTIGGNIVFINSGIVDAQSGTIDFAGNSATFNAGTQFTGAGVNRVSGNATFNGAISSANLVLAGGNFTGVNAELNGTATWSGGQFFGGWTLPANQVLNAVDGGDKNFNSVTFNNAGTINWGTANRIGFVSATLNNSGLINLQADANLTHIGGGVGTVVNTGTFRKSGGGGQTVIGGNVQFTNDAGIIDAQSGTINFAGGSATFNAGTQFTGAGVNLVTSNATFNGTITSGNLVLAAGNFTGGAAVLNGTATWSGGQFFGGWTLPANQVLNAVAGGDKNFNSVTFNNAGTINWGTANRIGFVSATLNNSGLINLQADANLTHIGGGVGTVVNTGTFRKSGGDGQTVIGGNVQFTNDAGIIDAQSGTINFAGGSATFNTGTQFTGAGVNLVTSNATFNGTITSGNLVLAAGNFTGGGAVLNGTATWSGGQLFGGWTLPKNQVLNAVAGGDKNFNSVTFNNAGTINWGTTERIGFASATLNNSGLINLQADANLTHIAAGVGTVVNTGTFRKSGGDGQTVIGGNVQFTNDAGIIDAQSGTINFAGGSATFNTGTQFIGAGVNRISSNATFGGAISSANVLFAAGRFTGNDVVLDGTADWTGGEFVGSWQLPAGQTLNVAVGGDKNFNSVNFNNAGTINWGTAERIGFVSATLNNTGLIDLRADANLTHVGGNASTLLNSGTFRKSVGDGTSSIGGNIQFTNSGVIDAQTGTINFAGGSATFNAGTQFIGAGVVRISNDATFSGAFTSANLVLSAGIFDSAGPGGATIQGNVDWTGGQFRGLWTLPAGQTMTATGIADRNFNSVTFNNAGTITWDTANRLGFVSATVHNDGLIDLKADANLTHAGGNASTFFNNAAGTLRKSGGNGSSVVGGNINFQNAGNVQAQSGTIDFAGGSAAFNAGTQFSGAGVVRVSNNASFNGAFTSGNLQLAGGSYTGSNAVLNGTVRWTGGQLVGGWQVGTGQTLTALPGADKNFNSTSTTNKGTITWQTAERIGFVSANVTNQGLLDLQADANLTYAGGSASTFVNEGVFRKSGGNGSTVIGGNITFTNPGTIEALSGTIVLPANFTNPGIIKGTATVQTNTLTNTGTIAPGASPGTLTLTGNLVMSATGSLDIEIESTSLHDVLAVSGSALLDGTLVVRRYGDYAPRVGDSFTILTYGSRVGQSEFDALSTLGFGSGVLFDVSYGANAVTLSVAAVPEPETYALMVVGLGMVAWAARRRQRKVTTAA